MHLQMYKQAHPVHAVSGEDDRAQRSGPLGCTHCFMQLQVYKQAHPVHAVSGEDDRAQRAGPLARNPHTLPRPQLEGAVPLPQWSPAELTVLQVHDYTLSGFDKLIARCSQVLHKTCNS